MILRIVLNFYSNSWYKYGRFSKTLLEKNFKFASNRENNIVIFYSSFVLLLIEIDVIAKDQSYKKDMFIAYGIGHVKIIFTLPVKVLIYYL